MLIPPTALIGTDAAARSPINDNSIPSQARSVMLATIADIHYLFVGLGDGHVVSFPLEMSEESNIALGAAKKVAVGTQPIGLACFRNNGMVCVFVASDRPAVIYCSGGKLLYANVNMGEVGRRCAFVFHVGGGDFTSLASCCRHRQSDDSTYSYVTFLRFLSLV